MAELITSAAVPFLPFQRYKESGLRKRVVWEDTWDKQRAEDVIDEQVGLNAPNLTDVERKRLETEAKKLKAEQIGDIPVPPKFIRRWTQMNTDFRTTEALAHGLPGTCVAAFIAHPICVNLCSSADKPN